MTPYEIAKKELAKHIAEIPGPKNNPEIIKYTFDVSGEHNEDEAWCSKFTNWCVWQSRLSGYKSHEETHNPAARSWLKWGFDVFHPKEGDIVVLWRESKSSYKGHVGFFVKESDDKKQIQILAGNQGDAVSLEWFPKDRVLGYRTV